MNENDLRERLHAAAEDIAVPPLRLDTSPRRTNGWSRRWVTLAAAAAVAAVAGVSFTGGLLLGGDSDPSSGGDPAGVAAPPDQPAGPEIEELQWQLDELPGVPFALPTTFPDGYMWEGSGSYVADPKTGLVLTRSVVFSTEAGAGAVHVCAAATEQAARMCPVTPGNDPIRRSLEDQTVVVIDLSGAPAKDRSFWESVGLTEDIARPWLAGSDPTSGS